MYWIKLIKRVNIHNIDYGFHDLVVCLHDVKPFLLLLFIIFINEWTTFMKVCLYLKICLMQRRVWDTSLNKPMWLVWKQYANITLIQWSYNKTLIDQ